MNKLKEYFDMKTFIVMMIVFTAIFLVSGSSLALWRWTSSSGQRTNITFTSNASFTCSANGGGDITVSNIQLQPAKCTDAEHAIKRQISYSSNIKNNNLAIDYKLYLDINDIGAGLLNSNNFRYAVTTNSSSCNSNIISSGKIGNEQISLFDEPFLNSGTKSVYLWIWLDEAEEDVATMNQSFSASLSGTCEVNENIDKDKMLVSASNFKAKVYADLGTAYQTKTGLNDYNPETVTFYANGHLPEGISLEELNTYANVDVSYKQNGKIKAYYNNNNVYIYSDNQIYANVDSSMMFHQSPSLTLNLAELDTSNVTNMSNMFASARATTLDLSSFNTSKVTNMSYMFNWNYATTLDVSHFDTSKVTSMVYMFNTSNATTLDLSSFDTSNVTNMSYMFNSSKATTIDLSSFDTSKVIDMSRMFNFSQATILDVSHFDTSRVTDMSYMFNWSTVATTINISNMDLGNYNGNYTSMFGTNNRLTNLIVKDEASKNFITSNFGSSYANKINIK